MHGVGGRLLERVLNIDGGGYNGACVDCGKGHEARFKGYRRKKVVTVLGAIEVKRAYYYCEVCQAGVIPKDQELDINGTSFSPGVRRMMGHVGGKEAFDEGRQDLEVLAGVVVETKEVERISESIGEQIERSFKEEASKIKSGKMSTIYSPPNLYIVIDGTGVPMVRRELDGRMGKDETGIAKTREAKLGCVFTQTRTDEHGFPVRDETSTTYVGAIEPAQEFGWRICGEAMRRGLLRAQKVIVMGDGAPWIWGIADMHFYGATQIVDLYHAREHLANLAKTIYGAGTDKTKRWTGERNEQLDRGDVEDLIAFMNRLRPLRDEVREVVRRTMEYFKTNADRMRYGEFRKQGLFVGSGVIEAGCKTIIGQRLKQSGMHWTLRGANSIIALRTCQVSGRWEDFWESHLTA